MSGPRGNTTRALLLEGGSNLSLFRFKLACFRPIALLPE